MEDLGAEIGKLGGLGERDRLELARRFHQGRVGAHEAVDVLPDLQAVGLEGVGDGGGAVVGAIAAQDGDGAACAAAEKAADDRNDAGAQQWLDLGAQAFPRALAVDTGVLKIVIGANADQMGVQGAGFAPWLSSSPASSRAASRSP